MLKVRIKLVTGAMMVFLVIPFFANAAGLIPCATSENPDPCTLCHLVVGFKGLVDFGMSLITIVAIVGIFFAGVMYILSTGDQTMMEKAKGFLKSSLKGFVIFFCAWLIVYITMWALSAKKDLGIGISSWNKFTCSTVSNSGQGGTGAVGGGGGKWKCVYGSCSQIAGGTYDSKEECEASATCKTTCADYHSSCNAEMPCCDATQKCVQNPNLPDGKLWCVKSGESGSGTILAGAQCGNENLGYCYDGNWASPCPSDQTWMGGGDNCSSGLYCCAQKGTENSVCGGAVGVKGKCKTAFCASSITQSDNYPRCESGLFCCPN